MPYFPLTQEDQMEMLDAIGVEHFGQLLHDIPQEIQNPKISMAPSLSEPEAQRFFYELAQKNKSIKAKKSFLGAGAYEHFIPSLIPQLISRGEFYTAYTPYQPEASQGILQGLFEYQSMICELTDMDVSNGSHYDGSTALAEAVLMAGHQTGRSNILVSSSINPEYRSVAKTYVEGTKFSIDQFSYGPGFALNQDELKEKLSSDTAAVVIQSPNFFGLIEDIRAVEPVIHENGSILILVAHPLSFGFYKPAGKLGVDIVCGEGQPLGIPVAFGGPWLGYLAATRALVRRIPGRLVGLTADSAGRRAFCLTLQAREQHIRREKATSNICTNQALCALTACIYLAKLGKRGLKAIAERNVEAASYFREQISRLSKVEILTRGPIFNEFVIQLPKKSTQVNDSLAEKGIIGGFDLGRIDPKMANCMLLCATETKSKADLDQFVEELKESLK